MVHVYARFVRMQSCRMQDVNQSLPKERYLLSNPIILLRNFHAALTVQIVWILNARNVNCLRKLLKVVPLKQTISLSMNGNKWIVVRKKVSILIDDSSCFIIHVKTLKLHIYVNRIQHAAFNILKLNLKEREEILIQVDYSENYVNKDQAKMLSAHLGQKSFLIFTDCCYLNISEIINENVTITSSKRPFQN